MKQLLQEQFFIGPCKICISYMNRLGITKIALSEKNELLTELLKMKLKKKVSNRFNFHLIASSCQSKNMKNDGCSYFIVPALCDIHII